SRFELTVVQETPDGGHELAVGFLSAHMGLKMGDRTVLDYDSARQSTTNHADEVAAVFEQILGSKLDYYLDASNNPERLEGASELAQRISAVPQKGLLTAGIKKIFSATFFEQLTNSAPFLPTHAVQPGDTWSTHAEHPVSNVGIEVLDNKVVFQNWEMHGNHDCARLELQGVMKVRPDPNSKRDDTAYHPRDGVVQGIIWFDPELGQMIEADMKDDVNVDKQATAVPGPNYGENLQPQTITTQRHQEYTVKLEL
ncbi:MAG TPA: hypothetical protein VH255_03855, partial [Verrucomicrobiae bacterium]|nr:hypothetical protein [Verrucomicrobiae bacterium]